MNRKFLENKNKNKTETKTKKSGLGQIFLTLTPPLPNRRIIHILVIPTLRIIMPMTATVMHALRQRAACCQSQNMAKREKKKTAIYTYKNEKLPHPEGPVDPNPPCLKRLVPCYRASGGAGDGGTGRDSLDRGRGGEKLFENLAVQVSLETGNTPTSAQETDDQPISRQETAKKVKRSRQSVIRKRTISHYRKQTIG